jgi:hypothetical protein
MAAPLNLTVQAANGSLIIAAWYVLPNGNQISQSLSIRPEQARELIRLLQAETPRAEVFRAVRQPGYTVEQMTVAEAEAFIR